MLKLKKTLVFFVSFITLFFSIYSYGEARKKSMRLSFTIRMESATFRHTKGVFYKLAIPEQSVDSVLAFTDRPVRKAFLWSPTTYSKFTQSNTKNSFKDNPPNLTVSFYPSRFDGAFEVISAERKKGEVMLTLRYIVPKVAHNTTVKPIKVVPENYTGAMLIFVDSTGSFGSCVGNQIKSQLALEGVIAVIFISLDLMMDLFMCE